MGWEFKIVTGEEAKQRFRNQPKPPLRCDDRVVDLTRCIVAFDGENLKQAWRVMWQCVESEPGHEPRDPYIHIKPGEHIYKERPPQPVEQPEQQQHHQQQQQQQQRQHWWRKYFSRSQASEDAAV